MTPQQQVASDLYEMLTRATADARHLHEQTQRWPDEPQNEGVDEANARATCVRLYDKMRMAARQGLGYCEVLSIRPWHKGELFFDRCVSHYDRMSTEEKLATLKGAAKVYADYGLQQGLTVSIMKVTKVDNELDGNWTEFSLVFSWEPLQKAQAA